MRGWVKKGKAGGMVRSIGRDVLGQQTMGPRNAGKVSSYEEMWLTEASFCAYNVGAPEEGEIDVMPGVISFIKSYHQMGANKLVFTRKKMCALISGYGEDPEEQRIGGAGIYSSSKMTSDVRSLYALRLKGGALDLAIGRRLYTTGPRTYRYILAGGTLYPARRLFNPLVFTTQKEIEVRTRGKRHV